MRSFLRFKTSDLTTSKSNDERSNIPRTKLARRIGRLSGTGAPPCLARRAGPGVGGVGEVGPDTQLCHESQAPKGRVRATLRRASKRWTSSSRSAQVARAARGFGPTAPACPVGDVPGFDASRSSLGRRRRNPIGSICRWTAGGSQLLLRGGRSGRRRPP